MKTLDQWKAVVDTILIDIRMHFVQLGEALYFAHQDLKGGQEDELMEHILAYGHRKSDIVAAKAAFLWTRPDLAKPTDKILPPENLFAGAQNSKMLNMDMEDHKRIMSDEKFVALKPNGKPDVPKTFKEMTREQRNGLISKGGKIQSETEQAAGPRNNHSSHPLGHVEKTSSRILFINRDGRFQQYASRTELAKMILMADCWEELKQAVKEEQQSYGK